MLQRSEVCATVTEYPTNYAPNKLRFCVHIRIACRAWLQCAIVAIITSITKRGNDQHGGGYRCVVCQPQALGLACSGAHTVEPPRMPPIPAIVSARSVISNNAGHPTNYAAAVFTPFRQQGNPDPQYVKLDSSCKLCFADADSICKANLAIASSFEYCRSGSPCCLCMEQLTSYCSICKPLPKQCLPSPQL